MYINTTFRIWEKRVENKIVTNIKVLLYLLLWSDIDPEIICYFLERFCKAGTSIILTDQHLY